MRYISTYEAMRQLNCSRNHVLKCLKDGRLSYVLKSNTKRKVYLISYESFLRYLPVAKSSRRIGRELFSRLPFRYPTVSRGYTLIFNPEHRKADQNGYVSEHVLVMEDYLKRPLNSNEAVYHLNRNRRDNRIENLVVKELKTKLPRVPFFLI